VSLNLRTHLRVNQIVLHDVAICPDILCNLVSFRQLRQQGIWWDTQSDPTILWGPGQQVLGELTEIQGQWVIEHNSVPLASLYTHKHNSRTTRAIQKAPALLWHKRLGHPGPAAIERLVQQTQGVKVKGLTTVQCNACGRSKAKRQISRALRNNNDGPGERLSIDFHSYEAQSLTKEKSQMLISDKYSGLQWDFYFTDNRTARSIIDKLSTFLTFLKNHYNVTVKTIEADNEITTVKPEVKQWLERQGIIIEPSAPDTQAQNGGAERSGGVNKEKARTMRLDANLSWELWPEITRAAVYLHNQTPNYANHWKTLYEIFFTKVAFNNGIVTSLRKPNLAHLKAYGSKAFALSDDTRRGKSRLQRLDPKAWIGYLVGYQSSNIYRIWIPSLAKVISTRDMIFDEDAVFNGTTEDLMNNLMHSTLEEIATYIRNLELPSPPQQQQDTESFFEDTHLQEDTTEDNNKPDPLGYYQGRKIANAYQSPPETPPPEALLAQMMTDYLLVSDNTTTLHGSSVTNPWAASFLAGTRAELVGTHKGECLDKAQIT
jgi:hypothetical protein